MLQEVQFNLSFSVGDKENQKPNGQGFRFSCFSWAETSPYILLLAQTNNACDVLEERLQRYIPVFDDTEEVGMNVLPVYRRFAK